MSLRGVATIAAASAIVLGTILVVVITIRAADRRECDVALGGILLTCVLLKFAYHASFAVLGMFR